MTVEFAGDVNADGFGDLIVGVRLDGTSGHHAGAAFVYSGADGSLLHARYGAAAGDYFGTAVGGVGDVNADGNDDFIVGAPYAAVGAWADIGDATVYSGLDGSELFNVGGDSAADLYGSSVCGAGDVNADGRPDFAVGAPHDDVSGNDNRGSVWIYSGLDGSLIHSRYGTSHDGFGRVVRGAGDVNADGHDDVVVSALWISDPNASGEVYVVSGANGTLLHTFQGNNPYEWFGSSCDGAGDVNADGFDDLIVGAKHDQTAGWHSGSAKIYSGANGAVLHAFYADSIVDALGVSVAGAGDVDGDGRDDVIVGASNDHLGSGWVGSATVFSGFDGGVIFRIYGSSHDDELGTVVCGGGDVDGDGLGEVAVVTPGDDTGASNAGEVRVLTLASGACQDVTSYCTGLPNSTGVGATLHFTGTTSVAANDLQLHASDGPPTNSGLFVFAANQLSIPFGNGLRCVGGDLHRVGVKPLDSFGNATCVLDNTSPKVGGAIVSGSTWNFQHWYRDPGVGAEFNLTDALSVVFCP